MVALAVLPGRLAVCRLAPEADCPAWAASGRVWGLVRTPEELSVVCDEQAVPQGVKAESGWRALEVSGPLDFALIGVLAALATPLAQAGVSIFVMSTFDTDYILVKETALSRAISALQSAGHQVEIL